MDGLSRIVGTAPLLTLDGDYFPVQGCTLRHYAEIESQVLECRGNPLDEVRNFAEKMTDDLLGHLFSIVKADWCVVSIQDCHNWMLTYSGTIFCCWQAIRHCGISFKDTMNRFLRHIDATHDVDGELAKIHSVIQRASAADELSRLDMLSGYNDSGDYSTDWRVIVNTLIVDKGVDPKVVFDSTIEQLRIYGLSREQLRRGGGIEDAKGMQLWLQNVKEEKQRAIANLKQGKRWDDV